MGKKGCIAISTELLFWIILLMANAIAFSQSQITFRQLSVKEGLSQNSAISVAQDSTGYLWIATQDGLNKYDGRQFTILPFTFVDITKPNYSNLGKVYTDKDGALWIIPSNRIPYKLNYNSQEFEPLPIIQDASAIYQDLEGNYWIGTYQSGLYYLEGGTTTPKLFLPPTVIKGTVFNIGQHPKGHLMMATKDHIMELQVQSKSISYRSPKNAPGIVQEINFSDLVFDKHGDTWIGTYGDGLYHIENNSSDLMPLIATDKMPALPRDLNILDLYIDTKNRLWIATYGEGLYMLDLDKKTLQHFLPEKHNPRTLHYKDILCIYEDYSGTMWFGTDGAGISYYDEYLEKFNSVTNYQTPEDISIDVVRSIVVDKDSTVWIGTSGKGLTRYHLKGSQWQTFTAGTTKKNALASNRIMSLLIDDAQNLWIGTQDAGLSIYHPNGDFDHYDMHSQITLSAKTIWNIFKDKDHNIWLGTRENGLIQFDLQNGEVQKYTSHPGVKNSLPSNNIRVITADDRGDLWIGTEADGIVLFDRDRKSFTTFDNNENSNSLSSKNIKSLYFDPLGILWVGTGGGGLNAYDIKTNKFYSYTVKEGLANNVIYAILPDEQGNLWLSSNKGITKFRPGSQLADAPAIVNYNNYDGLATEFNTGAYFKDAHGNLYFGGLEGFYWFKPDEIKNNIILPKTTITGFEVANTSYPLKEGTQLKHNQNTLTFSFSSLQYSLPEKNFYQYKLINYDDDWVFAGNTNFARYPFVPPGDYEFQVKSSNYDGVWNQQPVSFAFTIAAPWYMTSLAKALYIVLILMTAFLIYRYLKWRWKMKLDMQLSEEEANRLQRLNDFKSKLYTDISHEFRTPLTLIAGPVDAKLSEGNLSKGDIANFSMIKRNTNRLISLVDQLLHLAKLEKGKTNLKILRGDLGLFLSVLVRSFEHMAHQKNLQYSFQIASLDDVWFDGDAIEKIVTNLLSNALKYSPTNGICQVNAFKDGGMVQISIKNTVTEVSENELEIMFSRYYQKDEYSDGAGVGLSLVKELVLLYKGEITVTLEDGPLIHFKVNLPIERASFNEMDIVATVVATHDGNGKESEIQSPVMDAVEMKEETKELPLVLVVDDHDEIRDFLRSVWKHRYRLFEAENGRKGIKKALETVPDLILSDIRMPICDGIELCNTLKADERTCHIPIILLTGSSGEENELRGLQTGADDFVTKPFNLKILEKRVDNLIGTRKALRSRYSQEIILKAKDIAITPTDEVFLNKVQQLLDDKLSDPTFNAVAFSKGVGMSRMQLHRKLLAYTGLSTTSFIRSQRLKQALHILKTSDASVNEVGYAVGFNTPSYFIKCFKEAFKKTPAEYLAKTDN